MAAVLSSGVLLSAVGSLLVEEISGARVDEVCREVAALLPVDGVAVTVSVGTHSRVLVGSSDPLAGLLELAQLTVGVGPCTEATETGTAVVIDDLPAAVDRWPGLGDQLLGSVIGSPIGSVVATGLRAGHAVIGSMDVYRSDRHAWTTAELVDIAEVARVLGLALAAVQLPDPGGDGSVLDGSVVGGSVVDGSLGLAQIALAQATGMVVAACGLSPYDAVDRLRGVAFTQGRLVTEVAADVVGRRLPAALD